MEEWANDIEKESWIVNKHEEIFSIIYNNRNANYPITRYHLMHRRLAKITSDNTYVLAGFGPVGLLKRLERVQINMTVLESNLAIYMKAKNIPTLPPSNSTSWYIPQWIFAQGLKGTSNVYCSTVYDCKETKTDEISTNRKLNKEIHCEMFTLWNSIQQWKWMTLGCHQNG